MTVLGKRLAIYFGVGFALVPLLLFTYLGLHTRLLMDDYAFLGLASKLGTWESMLIWRQIWNGGYSNFVVYGLMTRFGTMAPPLFSLLVAFATLVGYSWLINAVLVRLRIRANRRAFVVALASLTVAATINGFYTAPSFFWFTAAVVYTWPAVMLLLGIALATEIAQRLRGRVPHILAATATAFYAFVNGGFSETHLVFQLAAMALLTICVFVVPRGPKRNTYLILVLAAFMGTLASLLVQLNTPGFVYRSEQHGSAFRLLTVDNLIALIGRTLDSTLLYLQHEASFAGFILAAFAGLFLASSVGFQRPGNARSWKTPSAKAPVALALMVQLIFVPILWSHQSESLQALGRFSFAYMIVICINLLLILFLLAMLPRRELNLFLNGPHGLSVCCCCILLAVGLLFFMTQIRNNHFKATSYLIFTAVTALMILAWQLTSATAEPRLKSLFLLAAFASASTAITLALLIGVNLWARGFITVRTLAPVTFMLIIAGLLNGLTLGASIQRGILMTDANVVWLQWIRLFCLLVALTIATGMVIGHVKRIRYVREDIERWESTHQEVIGLRDKGDPSVYTKSFPRLNAEHLGSTPTRYKFTPLHWPHKLYHGLDISENTEGCRCPQTMTAPASMCGRVLCFIND